MSNVFQMKLLRVLMSVESKFTHFCKVNICKMSSEVSKQNGWHPAIDIPINIKTKSATEIRKAGPYLAWDKKVPGTETEKFKLHIEKKYGIHLDTYWDLHNWSITNTENFWAEVWEYFKVISSKEYDKVLEKTGPGFLDNKWFGGASLNYSENLLRHRDDRIAIASLNEEDQYEEVTYSELYEEVSLWSAAFRKNGLKTGDRICCLLNNRREAIVGCLAAASIGAMWSGVQLYYGAKAGSKIAQRMEPKFLISVDRIQVEGEEMKILEKAIIIAENTPTIEKLIIIPTKPETIEKGTSHIKNSCFLRDFLETGKSPDGSIPEIKFEQLPFDHPLFLVFTSGTTGLPKAPVHGGGTFLPLLLDVAFHWNLKPGDTLFSSVPMGWAVWNWFLPCLALGVKMFLYSGCPFYTRKGLNYWDTIAKYKANWLFIEPGTLDHMEKLDIKPKPDSNLENLRFITICGSPVKAQNIQYIQEKVKKDTFAGSLYGTTESHGFLSGYDLNLPLYAGEVQVPALGKNIQCFDKNGRSVVGKLGELVITVRSPSFPLYLWKDEDKSVLNKTYLGQYPGAWCPKDECWINPKTKGIVIVGRSDDVLTQNGELYGSADVYFAIHDLPEIVDYICVSQTGHEGDVRTVLFVQLKEGTTFDQALADKIALKVERELWRELVPELILDVPDIPYNVNGKRMEGTVKKIVATNEIPEVNNIRNPDCLIHFRDRTEVLSYAKGE